MTFHSDNSFTDPLNGTTVVNGWYHTESAPNIERISDSSGGYGPWVTRFRFPEGDLGGGTGRGTFWTNQGGGLNASEVYWAARHKFSSNYVAHSNRNGGEKFFYPTYTAGSSTQAPMIGFVGDLSTTEGPFAFVTLDFGSNPAGDTWLLTPYCVPRGEWVDIAIYLRPSAPDTANGLLKIWVNGTLQCDFSTLTNYKGSGQIKIDQVRYDTTRGGGNSTVPVPTGGMTRDIDRMVLYYKV